MFLGNIQRILIERINKFLSKFYIAFIIISFVHFVIKVVVLMILFFSSLKLNGVTHSHQENMSMT